MYHPNRGNAVTNKKTPKPIPRKNKALNRLVARTNKKNQVGQMKK